MLYGTGRHAHAMLSRHPAASGIAGSILYAGRVARGAVVGGLGARWGAGPYPIMATVVGKGRGLSGIAWEMLHGHTNSVYHCPGNQWEIGLLLTAWLIP